jgi:DNA-binding response OmpR family regulator
MEPALARLRDLRSKEALKMRVLLAEDDPNISVIAKMSLEKLAGHEVTVVNDGEKALNEALTQKYDVILLDEMMPKMNGLKVCQEYKSQCSSPKPVIFLSAKSQESDIAEFRKIGTGFIPKPFDPMKLPQQILDLLAGV